MATRRTPSLARRLTLVTLAFVAVVWSVTGVVSWLATQNELNELLDAHLAQAAALLATGSVDAEGVVQAPILMHRYQSRVAFQIWRRGQLVARSSDAPVEPLATATAQGLTNQRVGGTAWRVFTAERRVNGVVEDVIHVGEHVSARRHVLLASLRGTLLPLLLALPLLALGIVLAVRRAVRPLRALSRSVARRQPQALEPLAEAGVLPEVRPLVQALNGLFGRVSDQLASERRFTADAAHELRTPIAAIRMQVQVAQGAANDAERAEALAATIAGCDRASRLVEQLLQLARLEADLADEGRGGSEPARTDLAVVTAERVHELESVTRARHQQIDWFAPREPVPVPMSAPLAAVLLRNLLDNALRYSPQGARVRVDLLPSAGDIGPQLVVQDSGPGLPQDALARLGERFFRVLGTGQSGSGLGWSIVRRLARLHGLRTEVDRSPELGGLRVRVWWPPQPSA